MLCVCQGRWVSACMHRGARLEAWMAVVTQTSPTLPRPASPTHLRPTTSQCWSQNDDMDGQDDTICMLPEYYGGNTLNDDICGYW